MCRSWCWCRQEVMVEVQIIVQVQPGVMEEVHIMVMIEVKVIVLVQTGQAVIVDVQMMVQVQAGVMMDVQKMVQVQAGVMVEVGLRTRLRVRCKGGENCCRSLGTSTPSTCTLYTPQPVYI